MVNEGSLYEISEEYVAKRAKGLQHLVLRYASLNPEMNLDAPQARDYDLDDLDQSVEKINSLNERINYEDPELDFEATIDEYPENVQEITKTLGWFRDSFDSLTLEDVLRDLTRTITQEGGHLLALERTGHLSELSSGREGEYSAREEVGRAFEWIESLDNRGYLDPSSDYNPRNSEDLLLEEYTSDDPQIWQHHSLSEGLKINADLVTEEVDGVFELGSDRLILYSGEMEDSVIEGEMELERDDSSNIEIEGLVSVDRSKGRKTNQEIITEQKGSIVASPSWNFERFIKGNNSGD